MKKSVQFSDEIKAAAGMAVVRLISRGIPPEGTNIMMELQSILEDADESSAPAVQAALDVFKRRYIN